MFRSTLSSRALAVLALAAPLALGACADLSTVDVYRTPGPVFVVQETSPNATMDALYQGTVIIDQDCVRLNADRHTVVWPMGFSLQHEADAYQVLDADGQVVGELGASTFYLAGGEVPELHDGVGLSPASQEQATRSCPGRFWIVAGTRSE